MRLFPIKKRSRSVGLQTCATAQRGIIPPLRIADNTAEMCLYRQLREAVPVIDAAVLKLIRLLGESSARTSLPRA